MGKMKPHLEVVLMAFVVVSSAVALAVAQECNGSNPCAGGECCSKYGHQILATITLTLCFVLKMINLKSLLIPTYLM
jgi:hypothetical protein